MTLITRLPVTFGAVVHYMGDGRHYLVVGFMDEAPEFVVCERPGESEILAHRDWLVVMKAPRRWKDRKRVARR